MSSTLPEAALAGFAPANSYDAHRPSYPPKAVSALLEHMNLAGVDGAKIIEIASGTGKFTEILAARPENYEIVAVEPHEGMRAQLEEKGLKGVKIQQGHAGAMGVADGSAMGVIAAQAFHWFANVEALRELHRVLTPGCVFGMIWNVDSYNQPSSWPCATSWEKDLNDMVMGLDDGHPRFRHLKWQAVFDNQLAATPLQALKYKNQMFSLPIGTEREEWHVWLTEEELWKRLATLSQVVVMGKEEKAKARETVRKALLRDDAVKNEKGQVKMSGCTYFAWTQAL